MSDRTRTRLLNALKSSGPQTAGDLSSRLDVTPVAIRQHLDGLLAEELVEFEDRKGSVGRPKRVWSLSPKGHGRFPDNHSGLVMGLLSGMKELYGQEGIDRLIAHRQETARKTYSKELEPAASLGERLEILAELRSREGYMASVEQEDEGGYLLIESHCSICAAATACQGFCQSEMSLFQELLGPDVTLTRAEHLLSGGRRCVYRIQEAI
ncbi:helix-turn-helix transcriptional regulator [Roseibium aggregatum]|uniref:Transcriptional regulator n=1 Tax=Roseibium aggregatum TaxID=187304 RepID=A0A926P4P7_9HYPH|nr:metalloregulator ArsR/SmtB family transcription factor [Roseibium aggregatum]MBD1547511.1 transcriptional regulator [Roseibium aggregatum]